MKTRSILRVPPPYAAFGGKERQYTRGLSPSTPIERRSRRCNSRGHHREGARPAVPPAQETAETLSLHGEHGGENQHVWACDRTGRGTALAADETRRVPLEGYLNRILFHPRPIRPSAARGP